VRVPVDWRVDLAQPHHVCARHRPGGGAVVRLPDRRDRRAEVRQGGVDDRHRVPLAEHEAVAGRVPRVLRIPAHLVVHQHGDEVRERQRGRRVPAPRRRRHLQRQSAQVNGFAMDGGGEAHEEVLPRGL
jgi:hypothetical protein